MIRKQIYVEPGQDKKLKKLAAALRVTEAEIIRRAIDSFESASEPASVEEWSLALETIEKLARRHVAPRESLPWSRSDIYRDRPRLLDGQSWIDELSFIEERAQLLPSGGSTKAWRREDSYDDERQARLSR